MDRKDQFQALVLDVPNAKLSLIFDKGRRMEYLYGKQGFQHP
jgi:hypothetical protein